MFQINDDKSIYVTRGDIVTFTVGAKNKDNDESYIFQVDDVVRIKVVEKKDCEVVALQKDFLVEEETERVTIFLSEEDTRIGEVISKPTDYWYEIELNPSTYPQTIIGYDEDGAKIFKLYPEGKDLEFAPTPDTNSLAYRVEGHLEDTNIHITSEEHEKLKKNSERIENLSKEVQTLKETGTGSDGVDGKSIMVFTSSNVSINDSTCTFDRFAFAETPQVGDLVIVPSENMALVEVTKVNATTVYGTFIGNLQGEDGDPGPQGESGVYVGSGEMPEGYNIQIDPDGEADELVTKEDLESEIADLKAQGVQQTPLFPEEGTTLDEQFAWLKKNGDTSKVYVLPDETDSEKGYIYAYMLTEVEAAPTYTNLLPTAIGSDKTPFVGDNGEKGYVVGQRLNSSGVQSANSDYCLSGFIPVKANDTIRIKNITQHSTSGYYLWYNSNFELATPMYYENYEGSHATGINYNTKPDANGLITFNAPNVNELAYVRLSTGVITANSIVTVNEEIVENSGTTITYTWANTGRAFVPSDYEDRILDLETKVEDIEKSIGDAQTGGINVLENVSIVVPSSDVAVVGREYNIYKNTIVFGSLSVENYDVVVDINDSTADTYNYNEVWRFTPTTAGIFTITIKVRDRKLGNSAIYATKTMTLYVVSNSVVNGKNVLFIGDSLTYAGKYEAEIQHNLSNGGITSIGTINRTCSINSVDLTINCEGRNGWATWDYAGTWEDSLTKFQSDSNVFRNPDTNLFDLAYYMDTYHSGVSLNAVCLNLGTNGVGATAINVEGMTELITRIREYSATLPILVHIPIVEAPGEFYASLSHTSPYMQMRWVELAEAFIENYDGTLDNVYVMPVHFNLDENNDFPKTSMAVSSRNPATIERITDGHPNTYGYLKMADVYYAHLLKYMN